MPLYMSKYGLTVTEWFTLLALDMSAVQIFHLIQHHLLSFGLVILVDIWGWILKTTHYLQNKYNPKTSVDTFFLPSWTTYKAPVSTVNAVYFCAFIRWRGYTPRGFCGVLVQTILKLVVGNQTHPEHLKEDITWIRKEKTNHGHNIDCLKRRGNNLKT